MPRIEKFGIQLGTNVRTFFPCLEALRGAVSFCAQQNMTTVHAFTSTDKLSKALEQYVEKLSAEAIQKHDRFTIAVSGGSLPKLLSATLKHNPRIDFAKWHIFFVDERCVPLHHDDSNYLEVKKHLLDALAEQIQPGSVHTINPDLSPEDAAEDYMDQLRHVFAAANAVKFPVFDVILLGMGRYAFQYVMII
jgi:6-phosphogluconolactonase